MINTAVTIPEPLLKRALAKSKRVYGKRQFSRHVRNVLAADLAVK